MGACATTACVPPCPARAGAGSHRCWPSSVPVATSATAPACAARCWTCWPRPEAPMQAERDGKRVEGVYAVIVTYHPELALLEEAIAAVLPQVGRLLLFDNATADPAFGHWLERAATDPRIEVLRSPRNVGLGAAINTAAARAGAAGFGH